MFKVIKSKFEVLSPNLKKSGVTNTLPSLKAPTALIVYKKRHLKLVSKVSKRFKKTHFMLQNIVHGNACKIFTNMLICYTLDYSQIWNQTIVSSNSFT